VGQGGGSAAKTMKSQRGEVVSRPQHLTVLWSGAPSSGTACSLELSLPSPTGIWFKTPLPVGGANTVNDLAARRPKPQRLQRPGVWGSPISPGASGGKWSPGPQDRTPQQRSGRSDRGIPTKPAGGLLSNIGDDDPCLRLTGRAVLDHPEVV